MKRRKIDMLGGNLYSNVFWFSLPVIASGIMQLLFNAIDMIVVGKFSGNASMAAVSSTGALVNLITNLFIGLSIGSSVCVARRLGKNDYTEVSKAVHTSIAVSFVSGLILTIVGVLLAKPLLQMMESPEDVLDLSALYLRVYFTGMLATMVYNFGSAILRAKGDTKRPLYALIIAGVLNALLNLFFVISLHMDVAGVGLASSISSYVSAIIILYVLVADDSAIHLDFRNLKIDGEVLKEIATVGIPAGIQGTVFSISNVVIQSSINSFGTIVMAGNGAASSIEGFVYNIMNSFYQCCLTFTSQNVGAGQIKRVPKILIACEFFVILSGVITGVGAYRAGNFLLGIYNSDPEVIQAGLIRMSLVCQIYFLCGIMDVFVGSLRGMGASFGPMIVSLVGVCIFRLVWIATYFRSHHTIQVLYASYPITWILTAFIHFLTFLLVYHNRKKKAALSA